MRLAILSVLTLLIASPASAQTPAAPESLLNPPAEASREENGLITEVLRAGTGSESPGLRDYVTMRVTVWDASGKLVQHTAEPKSLTLGLRAMLPGWRQAVEQMVEGEIRRAWIPPALGGGKIAEGDQFLIDTELLEILRPSVAPPDVAAAPETATLTPSGLAYRVLRPGEGGERPRKRSHVTVHYTGWTADGNMFDTSVLNGEPVSFRLDEVIRGWTEGLQLMTRGEKVRFWIPSNLAYGRDRTKPQGMLVFDIELIDFTN